MKKSKITLKEILTGTVILAFIRNKNEITIISHESGSGTRGTFIELFGVEQKDASGKKIDYTVETADITNSTQVIITSV